MSGHKYVANPNNLFEDEDDVDDETFLKNSRVSSEKSTNPFEEQKQSFEEKRQQIESRTLESTQRSLGLLHETEEVGKATAAELSKQRDQLEKSSRQLDEISATLRFSQKHLNGLKSVFGGLKNYLSGNRDMGMNTTPPNENKIIENGQPLQDSPQLSPDDRYNTHPINRLRSDHPISPVQRQQQVNSNFDQRLEQNLDEMCGSLSRLKGLATDLKQEIETQNDLLDTMSDKMENVDIKVNKQNKEMNKLLGKK